MEKHKFNFSIKRIVLRTFIISLVISVICCGALILINWTASANKTTERIASNINEDIYNQVYTFMHEPYHINDINHRIIENNMLDFSDKKQSERFFVGVLEANKQDIYSFSYGTASGEYYGARRNEADDIEIMKNNATTGGKTWYYSLNEDLTAGGLVSQTGLFDSRTRAWYKAAVETVGPVFSPIYKHFVMDDLTVSAAWPIYNQTGELEGVLGTHMLLSNIGTFLKDAVTEYNGMAIIVEKDSNNLIANSMGVANFSVLQDGTLERYGLEDIENKDIQNAYDKYITNTAPQITYKGENDNYFVNTREFHMDGIDWILISAVPESFFMVDVINSMLWATLLATLFLLLSVLAHNLSVTKYWKPLKGLLQISSEFSAGDLSKRVDIIRNDEIGLISKSFNNVADKMQSLINNLENIVQARTDELLKTNLALEENKGELRLILDSAAEAIYGIDLNHNCTFCNISCIKMLGYNEQAELLGKNMHLQIHHTRKDGTPFPIVDCRISNAFINGEGTHVDDEVYWRTDGTFFDVEYDSYPQIKNGEVIGAVITFTDISERKQKEAEIHYLSCYDALTGLHNRRCFDENRNKIDNPDNLPLSVIFGDINGLKMTNDMFGHAAGDELIKKAADILKRVCRQNDLVARVGGDEFIILMPKTIEANAENILARIKSEFTNARVKAIKCSMSLGLDTKRSPDQSLEEIMANAENAMYKDKTTNRMSINKDILNTIIETLHKRHPEEKQHSIIVSELCSEIGLALHLPELEISKLSRAGYLHDIGKITLDESMLYKDPLSDEELVKMQEHSSVGYRILNLFDDTLNLAEYVHAHHERWDGTGYPRGLKGEQIPLISRIIAVVDTYDGVLNRGELPLKERNLTALEIVNKGAGTQFDPKIVGMLIQIISKCQ